MDGMGVAVEFTCMASRNVIGILGNRFAAVTCTKRRAFVGFRAIN